MKLPDNIYSMLKRITQDEVDEAGHKMLGEINDFVLARYPKISLETIEANLSELFEMKKAEDACRMCMSWEQCPNPDLMKLTGDLTSAGYIHLSHTYCPKNYKKPKRQEGETASDQNVKRKWGKKY